MQGEDFRARPFPVAIAAVAAGVLIAGGVMLAAPAHADGFPQGPVTLVVGFPAGGGTDIMSRRLAANLEEMWGQPVVVENRVGAGGIVASEHVSRAEPDGYTLKIGHIQTVVLAPLTMDNADVAHISNFAPISLIAQQPHVVAVPEGAPFETLDDLVAAAEERADSGNPVSFGSTGIGGVQHLAAESFAVEAGIEMRHIPYQGSTPALTALVAEEIDVVFDGITPASPFIESGQIRPLAVTTPERVPALADVPTVEELGYPGYSMTSWWSVLAPRGIGEDLRVQIAEAVQDALNEPGFVEFTEDLGVMRGIGFTGETFDAFAADEAAKFEAIAADLDLEADAQ